MLELYRIETDIWFMQEGCESIMKLKDKIDAYNKKKAKIKALEQSAYEGQQKIEKHKKELKESETAIKKGIAKAKAGGLKGKVWAGVKKEAGMWFKPPKTTKAKKK